MWIFILNSTNIWNRAVRYDDIYRMDEIKSLSFHIMFYHLYRGVAIYIVSRNVNTFSLFEWLRSLDACPPRDVKERQKQVENEQPGQNEELVPKWRTTSVAWSRVFKHCSFKTTDFNPLKLKQQS